MSGLPAEAETWREGKPLWTVADELAAQKLERDDVWNRLIVSCLIALGGSKVKESQLPKPPQINHPGRTAAEKPKKKPVTDAKTIRAWFEKNMGGG